MQRGSVSMADSICRSIVAADCALDFDNAVYSCNAELIFMALSDTADEYSQLYSPVARSSLPLKFK